MNETWEKFGYRYRNTDYWMIVCRSRGSSGANNVVTEGILHEADADQIIADHDAARVLEDAVEALREIGLACYEEQGLSVSAAFVDEIEHIARAFFAAHPEVEHE